MFPLFDFEFITHHLFNKLLAKLRIRTKRKPLVLNHQISFHHKELNTRSKTQKEGRYKVENHKFNKAMSRVLKYDQSFDRFLVSRIWVLCNEFAHYLVQFVVLWVLCQIYVVIRRLIIMIIIINTLIVSLGSGFYQHGRIANASWSWRIVTKHFQ